MKVAQAVALTAESADDAPMADESAAKTLTAFLGVSRSLSGRAWRQRPADASLVRHHMQALGLDEPLARAMASREVGADEGAHYLKPTLRALIAPESEFDESEMFGAIKLSKRQKQLIAMLDYGFSNREIATELGLSEHTVKVHLLRLFRRLSVNSRTQALHVARLNGLL